MSKQVSNIAKGIGIIMMYIHHLFYSSDIYGKYSLNFNPLSINQTLWLSNYSKVCVALFVFVTAYGITKQYSLNNIKSKNDIITNTVKRYLSILMNYWFIFIIAIIVFYTKSNQLSVYGEKGLLRIFYLAIDFMGFANIMSTPTFNATWWYMSLLIFMVFIIPIFITFQRKFGNVFLIFLSVLVTLNMSIDLSSPLGWYIFSIVLGIATASSNFYEKIIKFMSVRSINNFLILTLSVLLFTILSKFRQSYGYLWLVDALISLLICQILNTLIVKIKFISHPLEFIGKNSMNMFLTHTFVYYYYFRDLTYSLKNSSLTVIFLLIITLLISVSIDKFKNITKYDKLIILLTRKANEFLIEFESEIV